MVQPDNPSFYYGWVHKRNPRTIAGVDARGRTVLITADGRSTSSLGLGIAETAAVARSLGLRNAMNLDGGGSATLVHRGHLLNRPYSEQDQAAPASRPIVTALLLESRLAA
jgi:exopolysaccharide biosynthesis protein